MTGEASQVVVLVRHGDAVDKSVDPARPLSDLGRAHAEAVAERLCGARLGLLEVRHSGKLRALETAEIFARHLDLGAGLREAQGLAPNDPVEPVVELLDSERRSVMLVGHLPFMGRLASRLLVGDPGRLPVRFADAAALTLGRVKEGWVLFGLLSHEVGA